MKKGLILTVMLVSVLALGYSQSASWGVTNVATWNVTNVATWIEVVNGIRSGGNNKNYSITVTGTISIPPTTANADYTFGSVTNTNITIEGSGTLSLSSNGVLLNIGAGQTVITKDVTLRGRSNNGGYSVVRVSGGGTFYMEGKASISGNIIDDNGGGVYLSKGATFIMKGSSSVSDNTVSGSKQNKSGGGVYVGDATFIMQDSSTVSGNINSSSSSGSGNTSAGGGGVYVGGDGTFTMRDNASVSGNSAPNSPCGGVYVGGKFSLQDNAKITNNTKRGVYNRYGATFIMQGGMISNNTGGGVLNDGTFTMEDGIISGNTADANGRGGGVYNTRNFTMRNGIISGNTSRIGGGVHVQEGHSLGSYASFTMHGGTITGNIANYGSGIYIDGRCTLQGTATVSGNKSNCHGGGVFLICSYGDAFLTMKDNASISGNTASGNGGGLYIGNGGIELQDNALISGNTAIGNGGGIYFIGKSLAKTGGVIYGDDADQNLKNIVIGGRGYAVYEAKNGGWRNATAGLTMNTNSYGFWLNEGEPITTKFPSDFAGVWKRNNFSNFLTFTENTVKSSSSDYVWVLTRISGNTYTMKRSDTASTITIEVRYRESFGPAWDSYPAALIVSGASGSGQDNWNGSWDYQ